MQQPIADQPALSGHRAGFDAHLINFLFRTSRDIIIIVDYQGPDRPAILIDANDIACEKLGYTKRELQDLYPLGVVAPETAEKLPSIRARLQADNTAREELIFVAQNGEKVPTEMNADMIRYQDKQVVLGICRDVSDRLSLEGAWHGMLKDLETAVAQRTTELMDINRQLQAEILERAGAEETLAEKERQLRLVTDNMLDIVVQTDPVGNINYISPSCRSMLGYEPSALQGKAFIDLIHPDDIVVARTDFNQTTATGAPVSAQYRLRHDRGHWLWTEGVSKSVFDGQGTIIGVVSCCRDITSRKRVEQQLKYQAIRDPVTGLYNRTYFEIEMARLSDPDLQPVGLIICDLDGLKYINDTLGHDAGDRLLVSLADLIRDSFGVNEIVARIGGDEFAVILPNADEAKVASSRVRITDAIVDYNARTPTIPLCVSVGTAITGASLAIHGLFKEADNSMYREKLLSQHSSRSSVVQALKKALEVRDFVTEGHATRLRDLSQRLAKVCGFPDYKLTDLCLFAEFHDIGKVGIPDQILFKPGPLTAEELNVMRSHAEIGHRIAVSTSDLEPIADWILKHHEWWNGKGYPLGLKGAKIPLECRILSIADAYDAMTNDRPYRKAMPHEAALAEIARCAGTQFDPDLVERFFLTFQPSACDASLD
ncbi:MAG TPA: PAS domain S-box protein [Negativicutes bacterium]|nr:PAS domain S-box protein [Negativicutes bacterium]